jgi:serine phosphatase RsbU (regulator of sigma subunit)
MDIGLVRLDFEARTLRFSSAKISLYWSDGQSMHMLRGDHRAICDQRVGSYTDHDIPLLPDCTYYLTTDGLLDQSGGDDGFSLGTHQFKGLSRYQIFAAGLPGRLYRLQPLL